MGEAVAHGKGRVFLSSTKQAVEGVQTARAVRRLRRTAGVETPILAAIERILFRNADPRVEIQRLMRRRLKEEG